MGKLICWSALILWFFAGIPQDSHGQGLDCYSTACHPTGSVLDLEWEYLRPYDKDRQIETVSMNILAKEAAFFSGKRFTSYWGLTMSHSWGEINRSLADPSSSAYGVGPFFLVRHELWRQEKVKLFFDSSVGLIFYNEKFPAGADYYNFMWRLGPKLTYQLDPKLSWYIGYKWMHISNGQISHQEPSTNPGYNATGFSFGLNWLM